jgi:hypothetical protein
MSGRSKTEVAALRRDVCFAPAFGRRPRVRGNTVKGPASETLHRNRPRSGKETEHLQRKQLLVGPRLRHRRNTNIPRCYHSVTDLDAACALVLNARRNLRPRGSRSALQ